MLEVVRNIIQEKQTREQKKKDEATKWQRLYHIAELFTDRHLERIDKLELVEHLMWSEYEKEKSP